MAPAIPAATPRPKDADNTRPQSVPVPTRTQAWAADHRAPVLPGAPWPRHTPVRTAPQPPCQSCAAGQKAPIPAPPPLPAHHANSQKDRATAHPVPPATSIFWEEKKGYSCLWITLCTSLGIACAKLWIKKGEPVHSFVFSFKIMQLDGHLKA